MKQSEFNAMTNEQHREIMENVAGAVYDGFERFGAGFDVVLSPDGAHATAISGGADYPWSRVWRDLHESDFGDWSSSPESRDYLTRDEFVIALCHDGSSDMHPPIDRALVDEPETGQTWDEFEYDHHNPW